MERTAVEEKLVEDIGRTQSGLEAEIMLQRIEVHHTGNYQWGKGKPLHFKCLIERDRRQQMMVTRKSSDRSCYMNVSIRIRRNWNVFHHHCRKQYEWFNCLTSVFVSRLHWQKNHKSFDSELNCYITASSSIHSHICTTRLISCVYRRYTSQYSHVRRPQPTIISNHSERVCLLMPIQ